MMQRLLIGIILSLIHILAHRAACALLGAVYAVCLAVGLLELAHYEKTPLPETGAGGAKAFGRGLARKLWLLEPEEYTVLKETPDTVLV